MGGRRAEPRGVLVSCRCSRIAWGSRQPWSNTRTWRPRRCGHAHVEGVFHARIAPAARGSRFDLGGSWPSPARRLEPGGRTGGADVHPTARADAAARSKTRAAAWKASITGADADYADSQTKQLVLEKMYTNRDEFARIKAWREQGRVGDPQLRRELEVLYIAYLGNQIPDSLLERMVGVQNQVDQMFSTFRGRNGEATYTDNELRDILRQENDSARPRAAWEASKQVGTAVQPKLLEVVRLRNEAAHLLGFPNFFSLQMVQQEFDETRLMQLFDELDVLTRDSFAAMKADVDRRLAKRYGIDVAELRPGTITTPSSRNHRMFRRRAGFDLRKVDSSMRCAATTRASVRHRDILARSDLYEKKAEQHAYCTNTIVPATSVFANIRPDGTGWARCARMDTRYTTNTRSAAALLLRKRRTRSRPGHGMLFGPCEECRVDGADGRIARGAPSSRRGRAAPDADVRELTFSRWVQVMLRFERAMYAIPTRISTRCGGIWGALPVAAPAGGAPGARLRLKVPRCDGARLLPQLSARRTDGEQVHAQSRRGPARRGGGA